MNCQCGDLCMVIKPGPYFACMARCLDLCAPVSIFCWSPVWHVEPLSHKLVAEGIDHISDRYLRPLKEKPGEDESLDWAPVPKVGVTA